MANLTYFTVEGHFYDVEDPILSGSSNTPQFNVVSAFVTFTARLKPGTHIYVADVALPDSTTNNTSVMLPPRSGRILEGELQTIDRGNTPDMKLAANTNLTIDILTGSPPTYDNVPLTTLIYDVAFTGISYAGSSYGGPYTALANFAFQAPTSATTVDLTDPAFQRLPYDPTNFPKQ